jgi:hypothetical protein
MQVSTWHKLVFYDYKLSLEEIAHDDLVLVLELLG